MSPTRIIPLGLAGVLLIDKVGGQIRFVDPVTYKERAAFKVATNPHDFVLTADRKTAYVPLYGDGIYGRNPNPGHEVVIVDMDAQKIVGTIDTAPYRAPHGIQIDANGTVYVSSDLDRKLLVIDPKARKVTHAIDTEGTTHWIANPAERQQDLRNQQERRPVHQRHRPEDTQDDG